MFGRRFRNFHLNSRNDRRAKQAELRANRSDHRWMKFFRSRDERIAKWKRIFKPFTPLNLAQFSYFWAAMTSVLAGLIHTIAPPARSSNRVMSRAGMIRWGGDNKKGRRKKTKRAKSQVEAASANTYENLEPRQLLAADLLVSFDITSNELLIADVFGNDDVLTVE